MTEPVVGILLAGGRSSRMGGGDKCLRMLGGQPLLARIIERLKPQVSAMLISANGDPSRFAAFGLPVVADSIAGFAGPLAGVHAGLAWVEANHPGIRYAVTVATDTPFLPADLVQRFLAARPGTPSLRVARSGEGVHPVIGLWPVSLAAALEASLKQGERKAQTWTKDHGAVEVSFPDVEIGDKRLDPFFNINDPNQLAEAEALLGFGPSP
ncbi:MAG TPA: molybdenum cofactor guanylyltransferase MobA [Methyloceanibacter sp.]|nr:molybdenum cofactor guanylyltransferase MobA [Methyloceanibacter sp.]